MDKHSGLHVPKCGVNAVQDIVQPDPLPPLYDDAPFWLGVGGGSYLWADRRVELALGPTVFEVVVGSGNEPIGSVVLVLRVVVRVGTVRQTGLRQDGQWGNAKCERLIVVRVKAGRWD